MQKYITELKSNYAPFNDALKNPLFRKGIELLGLIEKIGGAKSEALIVGGAVRDLLLGKEIHDIDIATNVPIEEIEANFKTDEIGANKEFGIINVHYKDDQFEVAHYRSDSKGGDGRRPDSVEFLNSFEGDSSRRDFTINAMGINNKGELVDFHDGMRDLNNKVIRAVGNAKQRFIEDSLRILRTIRFSVKFGFKIESETYNAMKELADTVQSLSKERIRDELYKVAGISGTALADYLERLEEIGLLQKILPELFVLKDMKHSIKHHPEGRGLVLGHVLEAIRHSRVNDALTNLSIAFHDLGKATTYKFRDDKHTYYGHEGAGVPIIDNIAKRLKLSNKDADVMKFCAANHMLIHKIRELSKKKLVSLINNPFWPYLKEVSYADEACRGPALFDEKEFEDKIQWAEDIVKNINNGGDANTLKSRIKELISGNLVMKWIPEINTVENRVLIGEVISSVTEWIIENNKFNASEEEVKEIAFDVYRKLKSADSFNSYLNK